MIQWINLLKELKTTNSNKDKAIILNKYKDNVEVKTLLEYTLNPYKLFYIKKLSSYDSTKYVIDTTLNDKDKYDFFMGLVNDLKGRYITGNKALEAVAAVFSMFNEEEYNSYSKVLLKEAIGVGISTVNKVWPKLIPEFDVMLAPSDLADLTKVAYPTIVQPKLDGFRTLYLPHVDKQTLWGRSGQPISNIKLINYFKAIQNVEDYVLDGELYNHTISFQQLSGLLNSDDKEIPKGTVFVIYDAIPIREWVAQKSNTSYNKRLTKVRELVQATIADRNKIKDIPSDISDSAKDVIELYKKYLKEGYEGAMVKAPLGFYQWKRVTLRSGEMLKLKKKETLDVEVKEIYAGEGQFFGLAGGICFDVGGVAVRCGSGFTVEDREEMAATPSKFVGKMAEIEYNEKTTEGSLRHPVFIRWRFDKVVDN